MGAPLLLHCCCAPDGTVPVADLAEEGWDVVLHFFGGNIHPREEYDRRAEAMRLLGAERESTLYVGDSDVDVETARNAGLKCGGVSWGFRPRESLVEAGADAVIDDASMLTRVALSL